MVKNVVRSTSLTEKKLSQQKQKDKQIVSMSMSRSRSRSNMSQASIAQLPSDIKVSKAPAYRDINKLSKSVR